MTGKKIFPDKNKSNIFFLDPQPAPRAASQIRRRVSNNSLDMSSKPGHMKTKSFCLSSSVDNSEQKFKDNVYKKIKEPNASRLAKKKENVSFLFNERYYDKFVNKPKDPSSTKNGVAQVKFELVKTKKDNKLIDSQDVKRSFSRNGINMFRIYDSTSGLTSVNNDKICFSINEQDSKSAQFQQIKKTLEQKGLKIRVNPRLTNFDKKSIPGIFPAKQKWEDKALTKGNPRRYASMEQTTTSNFKRKAM